MTDKQIIEKAIEILAKYGFDIDSWVFGYLAEDKEDYLIELLFQKNYLKLIFNHDFAEAMARYIYETKQWGKMSSGILNFMCRQKLKKDIIIAIKEKYLIDCALEKERLKYIEKFL